jgi:glutathione S-transferase
MADALYAPECIRLRNYGIELDPRCAQYVSTVLADPEVAEWIARAEVEPEALTELEGDF